MLHTDDTECSGEDRIKEVIGIGGEWTDAADLSCSLDCTRALGVNHEWRRGTVCISAAFQLSHVSGLREYVSQVAAYRLLDQALCRCWLIGPDNRQVRSRPERVYPHGQPKNHCEQRAYSSHVAV